MNTQRPHVNAILHMYVEIRRRYVTYIKEYSVAICVSVVMINPIKPLRKLDIAYFLSRVWVHHEAHSFAECLAVVYILITIDIQYVRGIRYDCRNSHLQKLAETIQKQLKHTMVTGIDLDEPTIALSKLGIQVWKINELVYMFVLSLVVRSIDFKRALIEPTRQIMSNSSFSAMIEQVVACLI